MKTIEGTIADELLRRISERLTDLELKATTYILERDEYATTIGQIEALRWCKEEVRTLEEKLL
jgi:hypothetical protein